MVRSSHQQQPFFNFDQVKSKTVMDLITKLINEVTNITETYPLEKGETAEGLVQAVDSAVARFLAMGEQAIASCPVANEAVRQNLREALADVKDSGQAMVHYAREFIRDSTSSQRRAAAVQAGRKLLHDVAKFLIAADSVDVAILVEGLDRVKHELNRLRKAESKMEVEEICQVLNTQIEEVDVTIRKRISELIDNQQRDDLLAARGTLRSSLPLVYATTKAFVRHPENDESRQNREYAHVQMLDALNAMQAILRGEQPRNAYSSYGQMGNLAADFEKFQTAIEMNPKDYRKQKHRPELEGILEQIVSGSASIADAESTRASRKQRIVAECNNVRQALQDLLEEYERNLGRHDPDNQDVALGIAEVHRKSRDLKRHLRRAIVDHISDAFLDTTTPLLMLIEAAKKGDPTDTRNKGRIFLEHAKKLIDVAHLACEMSTDVDGIRVIRHTAEQLEQLAPEVVHAAMLLCLRPESGEAQRNMEEFKKLWLDKVKLLTTAIDSMTTLDDFLAVSEAHIIEDCKEGMAAIKAVSQNVHENRENGVKLDCSSGAIRGRALRVCDVVNAEMDYMAASPYTERVKQAVLRLKDQKIEEFANRAENLVDRHAKREMEWTEEEREREIDEFIEACSLVHDAVKEIRNALLVNRNMDDVDSDNEYEDEQMAGQEEIHRSDIENQQRLMRRLPEEDKKKIQQQIEIFKVWQKSTYLKSCLSLAHSNQIRERSGQVGRDWK
ncbi:hypothetical protein WR25_13141 isoform C [Diploscapter pachys]|uniref:Vinculin n=1 Tax=Diploscapter pachys TaxID=2018661 RepID=A0A2A2LQQ2_9BILA|nr:hypothetical protein WR25_13141 isoform A [Diploscapter pachys]PAV88277.1 hypothetical protein WR25_13141 isoform C [Diploscapter pachys]